MKREYPAYWLVADGDIVEDHPEFISVTKTEIPNFDYGQLAFGRDRLANTWPDHFKVFVSGNEPVDFLYCSPYVNAVSDQVREIISPIAAHDVEFLPIQVVHENGIAYTQMVYWVLNILTVVNALYWPNTKWTTSTPPDLTDSMAHAKILQPCLYANKIKNANLFRLEVAGKITGSRFISLAIKRELEKSGNTVGIEFAPVMTT
jgi:hypothetical protein